MKKLLSLIISIVMVFTLAIIPSSAAGITNVTYYVDGAKEGEAVTGLSAGQTYIPNRMPAAKEDCYFSGWKTSDGNYVTDKGFTLLDGENRLNAEFKAYPYKQTGLKISNYAKLSAPTLDANGQNFLNEIRTGNSYHPIIENSNGEIRTYNNNPHNVVGGFGLANPDGSAVQLKPGAKYKLIVTYKVPDFKKNISYQFGVGVNPEVKVTAKEGNNQIAIEAFNYVSSTDANNIQGTEQWFLCSWHKAQVITGASADWQTVTLDIKVPSAEKFKGTAPVLVGLIRLPGGVNQEMFFKDITVIDSNYVEPATVNYYVGDKLQKSVPDLKPGSLFSPDLFPEQTVNEKFFAGWYTDPAFSGNAVENIKLVSGINNLYAGYKNYSVGDTNLSVNTYPMSENKLIIPSVHPVSGEYIFYTKWHNDYTAFENSSEPDGSYLKIKNNQIWNSNAVFLLAGDNGYAYQIKENSSYDITVSYKAKNAGEYKLSLGIGLSFDKINNIGSADSSMCLMGADATCTDKTVKSNYGSVLSKKPHNQYIITGGSDKVENITFNVKTSSFNGYLPVVVISANIPKNASFDIKNISVNYSGPKDSYNGFYYSAADSKAVITGCTSAVSGKVILPSDINGNKVTAIADRAFKGCQGITSVEIPAGITLIGNEAFAGCSNMTDVVIPDSAESIGEGAFVLCEKLENAVIPDKIKQLNAYIFMECTSLKKVVLPEGLLSIGKDAFDGCKMLSDVNIPKSVETIGECAFWGTAVNDIKISDNIKSINDLAFYECNIAKVRFYSNVQRDKYVHLFKNAEITCLCEGEHTYDDDMDTTCNVCSYVRAVALPVELVEATATTITVKAISGYEYSLDKVNWQDSNIFKNLKAVTGYDVYQRVKATKTQQASEISKPLRVITDKYTQEKPGAPELESKTFCTITVKAESGCEYSIDGIVWQDSNLFVSLLPDKEYKVYKRLKASDTAYESEMSLALTVKTFIRGDINDDGEVNARDMALLKRVIAGIIDTNYPLVKNPYVDNELPDITAADMAVLKKIVSGFIN